MLLREAIGVKKIKLTYDYIATLYRRSCKQTIQRHNTPTTIITSGVQCISTGIGRVWKVKGGDDFH